MGETIDTAGQTAVVNGFAAPYYVHLHQDEKEENTLKIQGDRARIMNLTDRLTMMTMEPNLTMKQKEEAV